MIDGVPKTLQWHCAPPVAAGPVVTPAALGHDPEPLGTVESLL
jgi:hypothetical protein